MDKYPLFWRLPLCCLLPQSTMSQVVHVSITLCGALQTSHKDCVFVQAAYLLSSPHYFSFDRSRLEYVTGCKYCCNYSNTCSIKAYNFSRYSVQHTSVPWRPNSRTLIPLDTNVPKASCTCRNILSQNSQTFHMPVLS